MNGGYAAGQDVADLKRLANEFGKTCFSREEFTDLFRKIGGDFGESDLGVIFDSACNGADKVTFSDFVDAMFERASSAKDSTEQLVFYYKGLGEEAQEQAMYVVKKLTSHKKSLILYNELSEDDRELIRQMMDSCSGLDDDKPNSLDVKEFNYLLDAVSQLLMYEEESVREHSGRLCPGLYPPDAKRAFKDADLDMLGRLTSEEVHAWLTSVAQTLPDTSETPFLQRVARRCVAIREVEKYSKATDLQHSLRQYSQAYRKIMRRPGAKPVPSRFPPSIDDLMQPPVPGKKERLDTTYDDLVAQGKEIMKSVQIIGVQLWQATGAPFWSMGPLKGRARSEEKIAVDYEGEGRRLLDVVRLSLVCDDLNMLQSAIDFMDNHEDLEVVRVKSAFDPDTESAVKSGGYRDCKLNVRHKSNGHMFEVQLHMLIFYSLKKEGGHALYKWARQFSVEGITSASDVLEKLNKHLIKEMITLGQEKFAVKVEEWGPDALQVMEYRMALVHLAKLADNKRLLEEHVRVLNDQVCEEDGTARASQKIAGASVEEICAIYLVCGQSGIFDADRSLELCKMARDPIEEMEKDGGLGDDMLIFLGTCHGALGSMLWRKKELPKAQAEYKEAVRRFKDIVRPQHPTLIGFKRNLGAILVSLGQVDDGLVFLHEAEELTTHATQISRINMELGKAYEEKKDFVKACRHLSKTLEMRISDFGDHHIAVANAYLPLGRCKKEAGEDEDALKFLRLALGIYEPKMKNAGSDGVRDKALSKSLDEAQSLIAEIEAKSK